MLLQNIFCIKTKSGLDNMGILLEVKINQGLLWHYFINSLILYIL